VKKVLILVIGVPLSILLMLGLMAGCVAALGSSADPPKTSSALEVAGDPTPWPTYVEPENDVPAEPPAPRMTASQREALESAQSYVDLSGFSKRGLLKQLTSSYGEGFGKSDAQYAVDHVKVDWNAEAVEAGQGYLDLGGFSRNGLIKQLTSDYGDQFTRAQATRAVESLGL
jgi:hypothetical protein